MAGGIGDDLRPVPEMQPLQDLAHVVADGRFAEMERFGRLGVGLSLGDHRQDLELARAQVCVRLLGGLLEMLRLAGKFLEQPRSISSSPPRRRTQT